MVCFLVFSFRWQKASHCPKGQLLTYSLTTSKVTKIETTTNYNTLIIIVLQLLVDTLRVD